MLQNLWKRPLANFYTRNIVQHLRYNDRNGALANATRAVTLYPSAEHYRLRGAIYLSLSRREEALSDLTEALRLNPQNSNTYIERSNYFQHIGDLAGALSDFNQAVALLPSNNNYAGRSYIRYLCDDFDGAFEDSKRSLRGRPSMFAYYAGVYACIGEHKYQDALDMCARATNLTKRRLITFNKMDAEYIYIEALNAKGDYEGALQHCEKLRQLSSANDGRRAAYYEIYGCVLAAKGDTEAAIAAFDQAIQLDPPGNLSTFNAYRHRGDTNHSKGDYVQAIADYTNALHLHPKSAKVFRKRGETYRLLGNEPAAPIDLLEADRLRHLELEAIRKVKESPSPNMSLRHLLKDPRLIWWAKYVTVLVVILVFLSAVRPNEAQQAAQSFQQGDYDDAITHYSNVIRGDTGNIDAYIGRCRAYYENGDDSKAVADCSRAIELAPPASSQSNNAYYYRGLASYDDNKLDAAVADLNVVIGHEAQNADAYYHRGLAYADLGKTISAVKDFQKALTLKPDHPEADYMKDYIAKQTSAV